jgi:hypothetical protein
VRPPEIMQPQMRKAERGGPPQEFLGGIVRRSQPGKRKALAGRRGTREHECVIWQLNERQIDSRTIRHAGMDPLHVRALGTQQGDQIIIYRDGPLAALRFRRLDREPIF